jgi:vanillate O-demethylase monooxygenase subunit
MFANKESIEQLPSGFVFNTWYVAMWGTDLEEAKLVPKTILNEQIVFFRKEDGTVAAITDRCPHRFAPLSMGKLLPGDRVQCIYHGLEYSANGQCVKNPHTPCTIPEITNFKSYPVQEKYSLIWIWMGDEPDDLSLIPDYSCLVTTPEKYVTRPGYLKVKANYQLVIDNLLDLSHTSYVHTGILGNAQTVDADIKVDQVGEVISVSRPSINAETPGILQMMSPSGFEKGDQWSTISWFCPSNLILEFGVSKHGEPKEKGTGYFAIHLLTPETERTTHYCYSAARWNVLTTGDDKNAAIRDKIYELRTFAFAEQDVPVIEAQQDMMDNATHLLKPALLSIDGGPIRYQRILQDKIIQELKNKW